MKKIVIIRHAKSSWIHNVIDHERPLSERGIQDAHLISIKLKDNISNIDLVISSDALRAQSTANIFTTNLLIEEKKVHLSYDLYDFSGDSLLKVIKSCNNLYNKLMIFGHNHTITSFVNAFGNEYIENVPTCGVVIIEFDINEWNNLKKGNTIKTIFPRNLKK